MKQTLFFFAVLGFAWCARLDNTYLPPSVAYPSVKIMPVVPATPPIPILRYDNNNDGNGNYHYAYETGNGIHVNEQGHLKNPGIPHEAENVHGSFSYVGPDGQQYTIEYVADENGFQPSGKHLPTPPPIPEEIQRSLEQNRLDEARGIVDDGQYKPEPAEQVQRISHGYQYNVPQREYLPPK